MLRRIATLLIGGVAVLAAASVCAPQEFVDLKKIEIEQVSNAVRLRLSADGVLFAGAWPQGPSRRISFGLGNVRSGAPPAVEVAKYPVSHLEFSPFSWRGTGIGLIGTVVLYRPGYVVTVKTSGGVRQFEEDLDYDGPRVLIEMTSSQDELLITVLSDRSKEPPPERPEVEPAAAQLEVSGGADGLSVHTVNADMHLLLERVSRLAQVQVYLDDKVDLEVTAHLESVPLARLLQTLVVGYGLSLHREGGAYFVSLSRTDTAVPFWIAETRSVPLRYVPCQQALLLLPDVLLSFVRANEKANTLVMNGPSALLDRIEQDLRVIDQPAYHCRLRAWVVSGRDVAERLQEIAARVSGGTTAWQADSSGQVRIEVAEGRTHELVTSLRRLATQRRLHIKALPVVQVKNGHQARLFVGEKIYWVQQSGLTSVEAGSALEIEPRTAQGQQQLPGGNQRPRAVSASALSQGNGAVAVRRYDNYRRLASDREQQRAA